MLGILLIGASNQCFQPQLFHLPFGLFALPELFSNCAVELVLIGCILASAQLVEFAIEGGKFLHSMVLRLSLLLSQRGLDSQCNLLGYVYVP